MSIAEPWLGIAPGLFENDDDLAPGAEIFLIASWCEACDRSEFPALEQCPACERSTSRRRLGTSGVISQFTSVNHPPPDGLVPVPYVVAVAEFPEGLSILGLVSNATSTDELKIGDAIRTVAAQVGNDIGYAFELTRPTSS